MKTASAGLINLLLTGQFAQQELYTFSLVGGGVIRLTTADTPVLSGGNTYLAGGPYIDTPGKKAQAHWKAGLDVDSWVIEVTPRNIDVQTGAAFPDKIATVPWLQALRSGALDGADVNIDRAYWATPAAAPWTTPLVPDQLLTTVFAGRVSQIDIGRTSAVITLNSHLELLTMLAPRNLFQSECSHTLFDTGCTLLPATFSKNGSILTVPALNRFTSGVAAPGGSNTYTLGRVLFTSGQNATFSRMVRQQVGTSFTLMSPPPYAMNPGDTFTAFAGCDKQLATCNLFANKVNFGGTPFIPIPEAAI